MTGSSIDKQTQGWDILVLVVAGYDFKMNNPSGFPPGGDSPSVTREQVLKGDILPFLRNARE